MIKYICFIFLWILFNPSFAQITSVKGSGYILTQERKTNLFNNIEVSSYISVYLVQGPFNSITVEADNNLFPYIITEVNNKTLHVYVPDSILIVKFSSMNILISLPEIQSLTARQHSLINASPQLWKIDKINLFASSGSKIHLATEAYNIKISAKTTAIIELKGTTQQLEATLNSASKLFAKNLKVQTASIYLNNSSKAEINVFQNLKYDVKGNSKLLYKGDPQITTNQLKINSKVIHKK